MIKKVKIDEGKVLLRDVINCSTFSRREEDWVLNFDFNREIPEELTEYRKLKPYKKMFVLRDLYKILSRGDDEIKLDLYPEALWWYDILTSPEILMLRNITKDKYVLSRLFANILASLINYEVVQIQKMLSQQLSQQSSQQAGQGQGLQGQGQNQGQNQTQQNAQQSQQSSAVTGQAPQTQGSQSGDTDNTGHSTNFAHFAQQGLDEGINDQINSYVSTIMKKIRNFVKDVPQIMKNKGYGTQFEYEDEERWADIKIPKEFYEKIKSISNNIVGYYYSLEKVQTVRSYPRIPDWYLADDLTYLNQILQGFYDTECRTKRIRLDIYIDTSGSMVGSKILFAKGVLKELRGKVKFGKIFRFCDDLKEISKKDVLKLKAGGGTDIKKVLKKIKDRSKYSLIITDLEDDLDNEMKELLKSVKSKVSVVLIGSQRQYEQWKDLVGISFFVKI